ncbi:hypothetical protein BHJ80_11260 [Escherichia coli]|nr:hypothetical protein BHJ80_11260 [Escherichia coli]
MNDRLPEGWYFCTAILQKRRAFKTQTSFSHSGLSHHRRLKDFNLSGSGNRTASSACGKAGVITFASTFNVLCRFSGIKKPA